MLITLLIIGLSVSGYSLERVNDNLLVFYDFRMANGALVKDRSSIGPPLDLKIENLQNVQRSSGGLKVIGNTIIRSIKPASKISKAIKESGEITLEAWIKPEKLKQSGPARIVTVSGNSTNRNTTLGQVDGQYDVRFRTSETNNNGLPSISSKDTRFRLERTHVVYTRKENGKVNLYINGKLSYSGSVDGSTRNWDLSYRLGLANEISNGRPWLGTYYLVAVYGRALSPDDIDRNYNAGLNFIDDGLELSAKLHTIKEKFFDEEIVPILSKHCLECHDTLNRKGKLDLSRKAHAYSLDNGDKVIIPGKSVESLLWEVVESDDMPDEREPLSDLEKNLLRKWIDDGAVWTTEEIDPLAHTFDRRVKENWVRRLTVSEYIASIRIVTGIDISKEALEILPPDIRADGFSNTAYNLKVDLKHIEAYSRLASIIVGRMDLMTFVKRYAKSLNLTDNSMRKFISQIARDFLRGELSGSELAAFRGVTTTVASAGGSLEDAVGLVLEAMLQSPRFIYRVENQRGDGGVWSVSEYELASRMSYIIWGAAPDKKLLNHAESGELFSSEVLDDEITRMLDDTRAVERSIEFVSEWLNLNRLLNMSPNLGIFKDWSSELGVDMKEETLAFFKEVIWTQKRPLADLLNADVTFATPRLAKHYGFNVVGGESLAKYDLSKIPERGGLLTQGSVLTIGGDEASMVTRGLFVLHDLFRSGVKDPPPCVDTTPVPTKPGLTQRSIAEQRVANKSCGGCHGKFEPLAYGLEIYDGVGAFHKKDEHGNNLRQDGEVLFPGTVKPIPYKTSEELMNLLSSSGRVSQCITWKLAQFALGRPLGQPDALALDKIHMEAQKGRGTYSSVIRAIVKSDLVQKTKTEAYNEE
ncbi:MAG: DUF1592 domain-containing protein [Verrucomicrobiota bacterium]|nr:DUF1592 domain-containing protein [Verrucomicrobiota bacterium]